MEKPSSYIWFQRICWLQIILCILLIVIAITTISLKADSGFWFGFQEKLASSTSAGSLSAFEARHAGEFVAQTLFSLIPTWLGLSYGQKGKRTALIISFVVELIFALGIVPIICLIIAFLPSFKSYLHFLKQKIVN
jgi:hypothetical protein